jgi:hypothetical protein
MVLYPDSFKRAQKEIDDIIGSDRLPEFSDRDRLPYVEGLVQEVMRYVLVLLSWLSVNVLILQMVYYCSQCGPALFN